MVNLQEEPDRSKALNDQDELRHLQSRGALIRMLNLYEDHNRSKGIKRLG
jgi:hypothetical protein